MFRYYTKLRNKMLFKNSSEDILFILDNIHLYIKKNNLDSYTTETELLNKLIKEHLFIKYKFSKIQIFSILFSIFLLLIKLFFVLELKKFVIFSFFTTFFSITFLTIFFKITLFDTSMYIEHLYPIKKKNYKVIYLSLSYVVFTILLVLIYKLCIYDNYSMHLYIYYIYGILLILFLQIIYYIKEMFFAYYDNYINLIFTICSFTAYLNILNFTKVTSINGTIFHMLFYSNFVFLLFFIFKYIHNKFILKYNIVKPKNK